MSRVVPEANDDWKRLRVGDRIRFVRMPWYTDTPGYTFPPETRRLYKRLIARGRPARVYEIDEYGLPWIRCRFRRRNSVWEHHFLAVNDDSWVRVKGRVSLTPP
ncbi:hypothetical protein J0H58_18805 [bacterium]|nr:hypothetical protein [bacterium]